MEKQTTNFKTNFKVKGYFKFEDLNKNAKYLNSKEAARFLNITEKSLEYIRFVGAVDYYRGMKGRRPYCFYKIEDLQKVDLDAFNSKEIITYEKLSRMGESASKKQNDNIIKIGNKLNDIAINVYIDGKNEYTLRFWGKENDLKSLKTDLIELSEIHAE